MSLSPLRSTNPSGFSRRKRFPWTTAVLVVLAMGAVYGVSKAFFSVTSELHAGRKDWEAGRLDSAEMRFRALLAKEPASAAAYDGLGMVAARKGQVHEASQAYLKAMSLGLTRSQAF